MVKGDLLQNYIDLPFNSIYSYIHISLFIFTFYLYISVVL